MMSLEWNDALAAGHPVIDAQHREIFKRFGTLLEACNQGRARESLQELFGFLDRYVKEHFSVEEELMTRHAYPARDKHLAEHQLFIDQLARLRKELEANGITPLVLIRTTKTLIYWLTHHIRTVDCQLGDFLHLRL